MWKSKDDKPETMPAAPAPVAGNFAARTGAAQDPLGAAAPRPPQTFRAEVAHIGKSVIIKGELSGSEDLYLDGEVEGSIHLHEHSLTVGPNGRIRANVFARDIVVHGKVDGNLSGTERIELKKSAVIMGDITTARIVIEDGAYFKGAIDIRKDAAKAEPRKAVAAAASFSEPIPAQASMLEPKA